jgi:hypothetical protein
MSAGGAAKNFGVGMLVMAFFTAVVTGFGHHLGEHLAKQVVDDATVSGGNLWTYEDNPTYVPGCEWTAGDPESAAKCFR